MMPDVTAASLDLARAIASNSHLVLETLRWGVVMRSGISMATEGCGQRSFTAKKARRSCTLLHAAWIDEDLDQGDTSDAAAVEEASDQQLLQALDATLCDSKMQERRDDAPTKGRDSIVLRALSEPDLLAPKEVDGLVRAVLWKAIHDDDIAKPAAKFCTRVIKAEFDGGFIDRLLWTCRHWFRQLDIPLPRSTYWAPVEPKTQTNTGQKLIAIVKFIAALLSDVPEKPGAASMGSLHSGHIFSMAALLCDSCRLVMNSPQLDYEAKVECLRRALTTAGEAAERGAPARMAALVACLRDAFLSSDVHEEARLTLLELVELHASGWKLSPEQQLYYASLSDAAGD
ncbi:hypothetical protein HPB51_020449 [Rhipicephalus microplus]|uniref:Uncharacterized protein n=1 Tax=Rhipicephalus microplus TaxID=6941 RepID=A0A9J6EP97_RHIMP|nr:hypothetical protein HPB51_020449 [Rhipicephalus microplus]